MRKSMQKPAYILPELFELAFANAAIRLKT